ncbi:MAG TPA: hypothetical protein VGR10_02760 [Thermoleophilaceae bacterium]|nr:hypothetical protein [Thermoleophilaceae bacterium]
MSAAVRPMALSPDEKTAYLQVSFHHGFVVFDLKRGRVLDVVALPIADDVPPREQYLLDWAHHGLGINPQGTKLCAAGTMSDYAAIVATDTFSRDIVSRGSKPYWSTTGPDGEHCWVSYSGDDEVVVLDYGSEREIARIPVGDHPQRIRAGAVRRSLLADLPPPPGTQDDRRGGDRDGSPEEKDPEAGRSPEGNGSPGAGEQGTAGPGDGSSGDPSVGAAAGTGTAADGGRLPFTGLGLGLVVLAGAALALGGGFMLRRNRQGAG